MSPRPDLLPPMHVAELWRYPVKSMAGEPLRRAYLGADGIPGDRLLYVVGADGDIVSARTRPQLLGHRATLTDEGAVLVDGLAWDSPQVAAAVEHAAGPGSRLVEALGNERFDILPLLVATDGAIAAFGHDGRRLRPNVVIGGVPGLAERGWEWSLLSAGDAVVGLADLRGRCITTTWDPDTVEQDVGVLRHINAAFGGSLALNAWTAEPAEVRVGDAVRRLGPAPHPSLPQVGRLGVGWWPPVRT